METWLGVILSAGGAAFLLAVFQGLKLWRDGTESREQNAIKGLERWRQQADDRADRYQRESEWRAVLVDYWRSRAGTLEYELGRTGKPVPPAPPVPTRPEDPPS